MDNKRSAPVSDELSIYIKNHFEGIGVWRWGKALWSGKAPEISRVI